MSNSKKNYYKIRLTLTGIALSLIILPIWHLFDPLTVDFVLVQLLVNLFVGYTAGIYMDNHFDYFKDKGLFKHKE